MIHIYINKTALMISSMCTVHSHTLPSGVSNIHVRLACDDGCYSAFTCCMTIVETVPNIEMSLNLMCQCAGLIPSSVYVCPRHGTDCGNHADV